MKICLECGTTLQYVKNACPCGWKEPRVALPPQPPEVIDRDSFPATKENIVHVKDLIAKVLGDSENAHKRNFLIVGKKNTKEELRVQLKQIKEESQCKKK